MIRARERDGSNRIGLTTGERASRCAAEWIARPRRVCKVIAP